MGDAEMWKGSSLGRRNPGFWAPSWILTRLFAHRDGSHEKDCEPLFERHCHESWDHQGQRWTLELSC